MYSIALLISPLFFCGVWVLFSTWKECLALMFPFHFSDIFIKSCHFPQVYLITFWATRVVVVVEDPLPLTLDRAPLRWLSVLASIVSVVCFWATMSQTSFHNVTFRNVFPHNAIFRTQPNYNLISILNQINSPRFHKTAKKGDFWQDGDGRRVWTQCLSEKRVHWRGESLVFWSRARFGWKILHRKGALHCRSGQQPQVYSRRLLRTELTSYSLVAAL